MRSVVTVLLIVVCLAGERAAAAARFAEESVTVAQVFELMEERLSVMPDVAAWKWQHDAPVTDTKREQAVIQSAVEKGASFGLAADGVRRVFELQIRLASAEQTRLHAEWRQQGFDSTRPVPSLDKDIRPRLDRITPFFLRALYLAASAFQQGDFTTLAAEKLRSPAWSDESRREALTALAAVRRVSAPSLERIRASRVLRIGTTGDYAPFSLLTGEELSGADIELAQSLARSLGLEPVFIRTSWSALLTDLALQRFDIVVGGVSVTPARVAAAAFSVPYTSGGKTIISRCRDARRFTGLKAVDRRGTRVIVNPGGTNEQFVKANIHYAEVQVFADNRAIFEEIRAGRADVMITDDVEVELQTRRHPDLCRPFRGTLTRADKAILMPKDENLLQAVNEWLVPQVESGAAGRRIEQFLQGAR